MIPAAQIMKCATCLEEIPENAPIGLLGGDWCCEECVDWFGGEDDPEPETAA